MNERGSASVEFVMVGVLTTLLVLGVMQLALALHVRNTLVDAAAEGARYGALADKHPEEGAGRAAELIQFALGSAYADAITSSLRGDTVQVDVSARIPLLGFFGVERTLSVSGHAIRETF